MGILLDVASPAGIIILGGGAVIVLLIMLAVIIAGIVGVAKTISNKNKRKSLEQAEAERARKAQESIIMPGTKDKE